MAERAGTLRVALVAGVLEQGGAEKQLVYMARALRDAGVVVRIFSLTRGEHYEAALAALGLEPEWVGRHAHPVARVAALARALRRFRPHVVQGLHFFTNLHVALAAPLCGAVAIGSVRGDAASELAGHGRWGPWLLRAPRALLANSHAARDRLAARGLRRAVHVLPNVIDLAEFDARAGRAARPDEGLVVLAVGRLVAEKRLDRFLRVLARARAAVPDLCGVVAGEGPEQGSLEMLACELGLTNGGVRFIGRRDDVPALMRAADILLLTSDHEGLPNVLLEAMAARLPVLTTPAGDAARVVEEGVTGFVVSFDDEEAMVEKLVALARSAELRRRLGEGGRQRAEQRYGGGGLAEDLIAIYSAVIQRAAAG